MSLLEALDVEEARSSFSQRYTDQPRPAASLAIPQPFTPPPMMAMSNVAPGVANDSKRPPQAEALKASSPSHRNARFSVAETLL